MDRPTYTIRSASADDADALAALKVRLGDRHHGYQPEFWREGAETERPWREEFAKLLADDSAAVLVAESPEGEVAGFATCVVVPAGYERTARRNGRINELIVHPDHRRGGLGRELIETAVAKLKELGAEDVTLYVAAANEEARRFYEAMGFEAVNIRMWKPL